MIFFWVTDKPETQNVPITRLEKIVCYIKNFLFLKF